MRNTIAAAKSSTSSLNWDAVARVSRQPVVLVNSVAQAKRLCSEGTPAIAVLGIGEAELAAWLRARGAHVRTKAEAH